MFKSKDKDNGNDNKLSSIDDTIPEKQSLSKTESDRKDIIRKEWKPYYDMELAKLIAHVKKHYGGDIDKIIIKKLEATARLCAKNKAITDKKYNKGAK